MLAIKGIYDGKNVKLMDENLHPVPQEVIVVFTGRESDPIQQEIHSMAEQGKSLEFLQDEPDLYSGLKE